VATCPYPACDLQVKALRKRIAQHAADADLLVDLLQRLTNLLDDYKPGDPIGESNEANPFTIRRSGIRGAEYVSAMHAAAHGQPSNLPTMSDLNAWRVEATKLTSRLAKYDTEWYADYWHEKLMSGVRAPRELDAAPRRQGFI
jgi:hypothetical protein